MYDFGDTSNYNDDVNHAFDALLDEEVAAFWEEVDAEDRANLRDVNDFQHITDEWYEANLADWYKYTDEETF